MLSRAIQATPIIGDLRNCVKSAPLLGVRKLRPGSFFIGNAEPSLDELMDDPIMRGMMACDGVAPDSLRVLMDAVRIRLL